MLHYIANTILSVIVTALFFVLCNRPKRRPNEPPLSYGYLPYIGHGVQFVTDFEGLMMDLRKRLGSIFTIVNFGQRMHFVTDYTSIRKIWTQSSTFGFADFAYKAEAAFSGLETAEELKLSGVGAIDLAQFAHRMRGEDDLNELAVRFNAALEDAIKNYNEILQNSEWQEMDLREFCGILVFYASGRSLFGKKWLADDGIDVREAARQYSIFENVAPGIVAELPYFMIKEGCKARDWITQNILLPVIIPKNTADDDDDNGNDNNDDGHPYMTNYLAKLKAAYAKRQTKNAGMKIAARLNGLLFAINTNTMNMLFWTLARIQLSSLSSNDDKKNVCLKSQLQKEMETAMSSHNPFTSYLECKRNMPLLNSIIIETFRLHGDPNSFRVVEKDCIVSGLGKNKDQTFAFRKGDSVFLLSTYDQLQDLPPTTKTATNKDNSNNNNKDKSTTTFDGTRWIAQTSDPEINKSLLAVSSDQVLAPFGGGKHLCPGRHFALLEMHLVISFCFQHYDFQLLTDQNNNEISKLPSKVVELSAPINQPKTPFMVRFRYKK